MGEGVIKYMVILYSFLGWFDIGQIIAPAGGHFANLYEARMVQSQAGPNTDRCESSWPNHWVYCEQ